MGVVGNPNEGKNLYDNYYNSYSNIGFARIRNRLQNSFFFSQYDKGPKYIIKYSESTPTKIIVVADEMVPMFLPQLLHAIIHRYIHTDTLTKMNTHTPTNEHKNSYAHTNTHSYTHIYTQKHINTHSHKKTHI